MRPGRIQPEKLAVESMGNPGQRMPIGRLTAGKRPLDGIPGQARAHVSVIDNVQIVVEVGESVMYDIVVESQRQQRQQKTQHRASLFLRKKQVCRGTRNRSRLCARRTRLARSRTIRSRTRRQAFDLWF